MSERQITNIVGTLPAPGTFTGATNNMREIGVASTISPEPLDKSWWRKMLWNSCTGLIGQEVCWQFEHWTKKYHCYTYVKPHPIETPKLLAARDKFRQAMNAWKALSNLEREEWEEFYKLRNYTGRNKFISKFILGLPLEIDKYRY